MHFDDLNHLIVKIVVRLRVPDMSRVVKLQQESGSNSPIGMAALDLEHGREAAGHGAEEVDEHMGHVLADVGRRWSLEVLMLCGAAAGDVRSLDYKYDQLAA